MTDPLPRTQPAHERIDEMEQRLANLQDALSDINSRVGAFDDRFVGNRTFLLFAWWMVACVVGLAVAVGVG